MNKNFNLPLRIPPEVLKQLQENILCLFALHENSKKQILSAEPHLYGDVRTFAAACIERYLDRSVEKSIKSGYIKKEDSLEFKIFILTKILAEILINPALPLEMIANIGDTDK